MQMQPVQNNRRINYFIEPMEFAVFYGIITHAHKILNDIQDSGAHTRIKNRCQRRFDAITLNGLMMPNKTKPNNLERLDHIRLPIHVACTIMTVITVYSSIYSETTRHQIAQFLLHTVDIDKIYNKTLANHTFDCLDSHANNAARQWMTHQKTYNIQHIAAKILQNITIGAQSKRASGSDFVAIPWDIEHTPRKKKRKYDDGPNQTRIQFIDTEPIVHLRECSHTDDDDKGNIEHYEKYDKDDFVQKNTKTALLYGDDNTIVRREQFDKPKEAELIVKGLKFQHKTHKRTKTSRYGPICPPMTNICIKKPYVYSTTIRGQTIKNFDDIVYNTYTMQAFVHRIAWIHYDFIVVCKAIPSDTGIKNMILSTI